MTNTDASSHATLWKTLALRAGLGAERVLDLARERFQQRFRPDLPLHIIPYTGFANADHLRLSGRILIYRKPPSSDPESTWGALRHAYRRFETDEVPGVKITARIGDAEAASAETHSDAEGYFHFELPTPPSARTPLESMIKVHLDLPEHTGEFASTEAQVVIPASDARFGVISDIDDTVLVTNATSIIRMMQLTLLGSSRSRMAFPGVAAFYSALHDRRNPFFYVSSSPWNLHEFLEDFMHLNSLVKGPMLLRDFGLDTEHFIAGSHHDHKLSAAKRVLDHYPELPFILIGDSGQDDPEIYSELIDAYPGRIHAVYIRDVSERVRDQQVQALIAKADARGVEMLLVPDSHEAAVHAVSKGFMSDTALAAIDAGVSDDRQPLPMEDEQA